MADETPRRPGISASSGNRDGARRRAQMNFATPEARETAFRIEVARERTATDAKTAKLRALRLAKEEEERIAAENAPPPVKKPRVRAAKPPAA